MSSTLRRTIHAIDEPGLGNTSYLVELGDGTALVVDPPRDVVPHLALAEELSVRVVAGLETHLHADFVSGSRELADAVGAEVIAPEAGRLAFGHHAVSEGGDALTLGDVTVRVLHTPGHTPEHVSYLVERDGDAAVFSGGSLIAGGAARTDLIASDRTEELARAQFHSLRRLAELPGGTLLCPTHGAGSFCSAGPGASRATTIAAETAANPLLQIDDVDVFVDVLVGGFGSFPPYFLRLREVNRRGPRLVRELDQPPSLDPGEVKDAVTRGAWLVDARPFGDWARAHPVGAISIEWRPAFASWLGWVVPFGAQVILVIDEDRMDEALRDARSIGYDRVIGRLDPGDGATFGSRTTSADVVDAEEAARRVSRGTTLVDVRQRSELADGSVRDAVHLELGEIIAGAMPNGAVDVVTFCGHGERAATAASLLERRGLRAAVLRGGPDDLEAAGCALAR
jgi:hydroxyacylglutathione hydrolase